MTRLYAALDAAETEGRLAGGRAAVVAFLRAINPAPECRSGGGFYIAVNGGLGLAAVTLHDLAAEVEATDA
jgi:hypothetical protein